MSILTGVYVIMALTVGASLLFTVELAEDREKGAGYLFTVVGVLLIIGAIYGVGNAQC